MVDYYGILGVAPDADEDTIKKRYHKLAKENHPDLHPGDKAAEARFKELGEAWEVLGNSDTRAKYDAGRVSSKTASNNKRVTPMGEVDYSKVMSQFDAFFGKAVKPPNGQKAKNPLDASELFENFMGLRKK